MKKSAVLKHYKSAYRLAKVLGISQSSISRWGPVIPELRARQLEELSSLKFDPKLYPPLPVARNL